MFSSIPTVREVHSIDTLPDRVRGYPRDTVTLAWEERLKARARRRSDSGLEFATLLSRGTVLRDGDCLILDGAALVVRVVERAEPVFVIHPADARESALFAYHIGNSHQPLMLLEDAIVCADLPGMEQVLAYYRIPFSRAVRAFTPVTVVTNHRHQLST